MSRILITLVAVGALALLAACGDDGPTGPTPPEKGLLAYGNVTCEGEIPIEKVKIIWSCITCNGAELGARIQANPNGTYAFECLNPEAHVLHCVIGKAFYTESEPAFSDEVIYDRFPAPPVKHDFYLRRKSFH